MEAAHIVEQPTHKEITPADSSNNPPKWPMILLLSLFAFSLMLAISAFLSKGIQLYSIKNLLSFLSTTSDKN